MIAKDIIDLLNFIVFSILTGLGGYGIKLLWSKVHKDNQLKEKQLENAHKDGMCKTLKTVDSVMQNLVPLAAVDVETPKGQRKKAVISAARTQLQAYGINDETVKMLSGSAEKIYQRYKANKYYVANPRPAHVIPDMSQQNIPVQNNQPIQNDNQGDNK